MKLTLDEQNFSFWFKKGDVSEVVTKLQEYEFPMLTNIKKTVTKDLIFVRSDECRFHLSDSHTIVETRKTDDVNVNKVSSVLEYIFSLLRSTLKDYLQGEINQSCTFRSDKPLDKIYSDFVNNEKLSSLGLGKIVSKGLKLKMNDDKISMILDSTENKTKIDIQMTTNFSPTIKIDMVENRKYLENYLIDVMKKMGVE